MFKMLYTTDLVEVRVGLRLSYAIEIFHVDQLEVEGEAGVWYLELRQQLDMRQVPQVLIAPVIQVTQAVEMMYNNTLYHAVTTLLL